MNDIKTLVKATQPLIDIDVELVYLKDKLNSHKIYQVLKSVNDVQVFMENHVFAVWDFMSVLKALQLDLTTVTVPWTPNNNPNTARFINEIVHGEESDLDIGGQPKSHFEMYLDAMTEINANRTQIDSFIKKINSNYSVSDALNKVHIDENVRDFTHFTFEIIESGKIHCIAAAFTYGREDIIPEMFIEIINELEPENIHCNKLKYYLERHIEIDGDLHGPIAREMVKELCGTDKKKWEEVLNVGRECILKRIQLWDAIHDIIV